MDVKYRFNGFTVDPVRRLLFGADGQPIPLKPRVFDTLLFLIEHRGELLEKQTLLDTIWPHVVVEENNLNQAISTLRRVFGETRDDHRFIVTEPGRGYRFVAAVEVGLSAAHAPNPTAPPGAASVGRRGMLWGSAAVVATVAIAGAWLGSSPTARPVPSELGDLVSDATITTYAGNEVGPALSPDGASVVFSRDDQGASRDLYVARIGGSGSAQLTVSPEPDRFPAWSPDGADIAFLRQMGPSSFDLFVVPAVGGRERRITTVFLRPADIFASPPLAWTPQGDGVLFTTRSSDDDAAAHHIYRLTLATGELVPLTTGDDVYDTSPAMSRDGRWLAFVRHPDFLTHLRGTLIVQPLGADAGARESIVVPLNAPENTTGDAVHSPLWSADGRYLTFVAGVELREWELGDAESRLVYPGAAYFGGITLAGDISALTMVRDGPRARAVVARIGPTSDIFALPLAPSTHEVTGPPVARLVSSAGDAHPRFSPDGHRVAFVSTRDGRPDVWIAMADGRDPTRLTKMGQRIVGFPRWSRDGERIAFHSQVGLERQVFVVDPDGGVPQRIAAGCCVDWSLDGEYIYAMDVGQVPTLSRIRVADGQREPLFTGLFPTLTADGSRLLYGKQGEQNVYARAVVGDLRNNPEEILVTDAFPAGIAATPDGFFYLGYTPENRSPPVRFYDYATHSARTVANISGRGVEILTVPPDGTELVYGAQAESGADLVLLEFGEPWR